MQVTKIEEGKGKCYRVYGDEEYLFSLYGTELKQYHITEWADIDSDVIRDIIDNLIYKRARERALYLLERRPLSIRMMKEKLQRNEYPDDVIDRVVLFLRQYQYLDDAEYVRMYVNSYGGRKSKRQLCCDLLTKGLAKDVIDDYFAQNDYSEEQSFSIQFERYIRGKNLQDYSVRNKVFRYFYGKGFSASLIESYLKEREI